MSLHETIFPWLDEPLFLSFSFLPREPRFKPVFNDETSCSDPSSDEEVEEEEGEEEEEEEEEEEKEGEEEELETLSFDSGGWDSF